MMPTQEITREMSLTQNISHSIDFFAEIYDSGPGHVTAFAASCVVAPISIVLFYSIIWFEHYGVDLKRTLINKSIASMCWCGVYLESVGFWVSSARFLFGPLSSAVCYVKTALTYSVLASALVFQDISLVARYFYIFVLKNPAAVEDEFWWVKHCLQLGSLVPQISSVSHRTLLPSFL